MGDISESDFAALLRTMSNKEPKSQSEDIAEEAVLQESVNVDFDVQSEAFVEREFEEVEEEPKKSEAKEPSSFGRYLRHFGEKILKGIMPDETGMV